MSWAILLLPPPSSAGGRPGAYARRLRHSLGLKVVQPVVLSPLPVERLKTALRGVERLIAVEENATAQLVALIEREGIRADKKILRYDGRPFTVDELVRRVSGVIA